MPASIVVNSARYPFTDPSIGQASVTVTAGNPYATDGVALLPALVTALATHFGSSSFVPTSILPFDYLVKSECGDYSAGYDPGNDLFLVRDLNHEAVWSDAIGVDTGVTEVGDLPDGTVAVYAVEATAGGTTGSTTIMHTAAAVTECNVDVGAGTVTFAAGDAVTEMRVLHKLAPSEAANATDLSGVDFSFTLNYMR